MRFSVGSGLEQVLAALDDAGHGPVGHAGLLGDAALALEAQRQLAGAHLGSHRLPQGAIKRVLAVVLVIAGAKLLFT